MSNLIYNRIVIIIFTLVTFVLIGCSERITEPSPDKVNPNALHNIPRLLIPTTYVRGHVYLGETAINGATVYLLDEYNEVLTQTTTSGGGYYNMIICP